MPSPNREPLEFHIRAIFTLTVCMSHLPSPSANKCQMLYSKNILYPNVKLMMSSQIVNSNDKKSLQMNSKQLKVKANQFSSSRKQTEPLLDILQHFQVTQIAQNRNLRNVFRFEVMCSIENNDITFAYVVNYFGRRCDVKSNASQQNLMVLEFFSVLC